MGRKRTGFRPSKYDAQTCVAIAFERAKFDPDMHPHPEFTVPQLVERLQCDGNPLSASEVRRVLGWFYGRGRAKVVAVDDGEERWRLSSDDDYLKR